MCPTGAAAVTRDDDDDDDDDTCPVANADGGSGADRENDDDDDAARDVEEEPRRPASAVIGDSDSRDAEVLDANDAATECGAASESDADEPLPRELQLCGGGGGDDAPPPPARVGGTSTGTCATGVTPSSMSASACSGTSLVSRVHRSEPSGVKSTTV